eukprot:scaffold108460_cov17-Prasinocladus_malaysianus.AAC.2
MRAMRIRKCRLLGGGRRHRSMAVHEPKLEQRCVEAMDEKTGVDEMVDEISEDCGEEAEVMPTTATAAPLLGAQHIRQEIAEDGGRVMSAKRGSGDYYCGSG